MQGLNQLINLVQTQHIGFSYKYFLPLFCFRPTLNITGNLMLRVVHIRNKKRSNKHGILQTRSIISVAMLLNQQEGEIAKKVLLSVI